MLCMQSIKNDHQVTLVSQIVGARGRAEGNTPLLIAEDSNVKSRPSEHHEFYVSIFKYIIGKVRPDTCNIVLYYQIS